MFGVCYGKQYIQSLLSLIVGSYFKSVIKLFLSDRVPGETLYLVYVYNCVSSVYKW